MEQKDVVSILRCSCFQTTLADFSSADVAFLTSVKPQWMSQQADDPRPDEDLADSISNEANREAALRNDHMKSRKSKWSEEELRQLAEIVAAGGTPLRAAAKLKRNMTSCRIQARAMGLPFSPLRVRQKNLRQKCAAAEKQMAR